jgi:hypothetical protein
MKEFVNHKAQPEWPAPRIESAFQLEGACSSMRLDDPLCEHPSAKAQVRQPRRSMSAIWNSLADSIFGFDRLFTIGGDQEQDR